MRLFESMISEEIDIFTDSSDICAVYDVEKRGQQTLKAPRRDHFKASKPTNKAFKLF